MEDATHGGGAAEMTDGEGQRRVAGMLAEQATWCERLGSPLYRELLDLAAEDVRAGGPVWSVLERHADDPASSMLPLRLMGAVHRVVLQGRAPDLARHYPSAGGKPGAEAWQAFRATVVEHAARLIDMVRQPVQTNEVGRSAALLGGFLTVSLETELPLRVLEIGASAGLNLRWDRYRYDTPHGSWGDPASPVRLANFLIDGRLPLDARAEILERRGCDADPVNPGTEEGRLTLLSFVWPDQLARIQRLRGALATAVDVPAPVDAEDAAAWLEHRLRPNPGSATVVFHSVVWQYLGDDAQARVRAAVAASGVRAESDAPVAWLRLEAGGDEAEVRLTQWPGGRERRLAIAGWHGRRVRWLG
jgi:hypothetical protein